MTNSSHDPVLLVGFLHIYAFLTFPDPTEGLIGLLNLSFKYTLYKKDIKVTLRSIHKFASFIQKVIARYFHIFTIIILQFKQYQSTEHLAIYRYRYEIKTNKTETGSIVIFSRPLFLFKEYG